MLLVSCSNYMLATTWVNSDVSTTGKVRLFQV